MNLHTLQPDHKLASRKRVGRGGKRGTYSGRGMKGQNSRSGGRVPELFTGGAPSFTGRGSRVVHKMRGDGNIVGTSKKYVTLNISKIDSLFGDKEIVSVVTLREKGLVSKNDKVAKIIGEVDSDKKFVFEGVQTSKGVQSKYSVNL
jgi:large subunit ribosomal protein L15